MSTVIRNITHNLMLAAFKALNQIDWDGSVGMVQWGWFSGDGSVGMVQWGEGGPVRL